MATPMHVAALVLLAGAARAAQVAVTLPEEAAIRVTDATPPPEGPRIDCPPKCVYVSPGNSVDIFDLKVEPEPDPRIGDRPWDILAMHGCRGTTALPADNGKCFLPFEGDVNISFEVRYRPIFAVTVGGSVGGPLGGLFISGNPAPGYQGSGAGFGCNAMAPMLVTCARHLSAGQPVTLSSPSTVQATLLSRSGPCGGDGPCEFLLAEDTCIAHLYANGAPDLFPSVPIGGPECPTGPGTSGGGGGGGGGGPPPELDPIKALALDQLRREVAQSLAPCLTAVSAIALYAGGPIGAGASRIIYGPSARLCQRFVQHLTELQRIYDDPPDFDFGTIARVARTAAPPVDVSSCAELAGNDRRTCRRLGKATRRWFAKVYRVGDVATTLRTTVERASAAAQADEARALKRQLKAAGKRSKQLQAAFAARAKAGAKVASILRGAGVTGALSEAQHAEASTLVLGELSAQGLAEAQARTVLGPALTPASIDLVELLAQP